MMTFSLLNLLKQQSGLLEPGFKISDKLEMSILQHVLIPIGYKLVIMES